MVGFSLQEIIGIITAVTAVVIYLPYLRDTIKGKVTPHPFSWTIWVTLTAIAFAAQLSDHAGPGAWMNGVVIPICLFIIFYSLKNGFNNITMLDKISFALGIVAAILWVVTKDPTLSVIIVSVANSLAYIPTFRKSYDKPYEEVLYVYGTNFFRHSASIIALSNLSLVTALFPAVLAINNGALALFLIWRRTKPSR